MIYPITNRSYEISKSNLVRDIQTQRVKKYRKFEYVDKPMIDEISKELKRTSNQKNYTIILLEVQLIRFKTYNELTEGKYPLWVRFTVGGLVLRVRGLSQKIQSETDPKKQNDLISQQNTLLSYISGLGVGVSSTDRELMNKLKKGFGRGSPKK